MASILDAEDARGHDAGDEDCDLAATPVRSWPTVATPRRRIA